MELRSNVGPIIKGHMDTLRDSKGRISRAEKIVNFFIPAACSVAFGIWAAMTSTTFPFENLIAGLAILFGFFLALVTFVFGLRKKVSFPRPMADLRAPLLVDELFLNCQYAVIVSGLGTFLAILFDLLKCQCIGGAILIGLLAHLMVLVMMCLKRLNRAYELHKADIEAEHNSL